MRRIIITFVTMFVAMAASAVTFNTNYVSGLQKSFAIANASQSEIDVVAALAFDPTSQVNGVYDKLYLANKSVYNTRRGLYSVDIINETSSSRLAMAGESNSDTDSPSLLAVDSSGDAYMAYGGVPQVWKITDPDGAAVELQMLGNYAGTGDDDPYGIAMVPTGFGGGFAEGIDVVLLDGGLDANTTEAISIVDAASTTNFPLYTNIWNDDVPSLRSTISEVDGKIYLTGILLYKDALGGTPRAYISQFDVNGDEARVFLDIDYDSVSKLDDAIAINPEDGSLWITIQDINGTTGTNTDQRNIYRIDLVNAVATNDDYLASITLEIEDLGVNIGRNGMAFSPDGQQLAFSSPDDQDQLVLYDISTNAPLATYQKSFFITDTNQTFIGTAGGVVFDPTSQTTNGIYDRVYVLNRNTNVDARGLYSVDTINETFSSRLALGGVTNETALNSPTAIAVDSTGSVYACYVGTPSIWKVTDPSGTPVETQMLGDYDDTGDDDPAGIYVAPSGFGYDPGSLILTDGGLNAAETWAIVSVSAASTAVTPDATVLWVKGPNNEAMRFAASDYDGFIYFVRWYPETDDVGGTIRPYLNRVDSSGILRRVFMNIDPADFYRLDDVITINPADGSLWISTVQTDTVTRDVFRVDLANAVQTNGDYLAETTIAIADLGYNVGVYSMTFSPDGKQLAIGSPTDVDTMYIYDIVITTTPYGDWMKGFELTGGDAEATADPDGDGLNNLYEYGLGGDPTNSADQGMSPTYALNEGGGTNWISYVYPKRLDSGLTYSLELTDDLIYGTWVDGGTVVGIGSIEAEFDAVTNQVSTETENEQFIRLIIE